MNAAEKNEKKRIASYSRANVTSVESMDTECQTVGETTTIITTEGTIRPQEIPTSTGNATTAEKEVTRLLIVGRRKEKRKTMTLKISLWDPHSVEKFKKITMKKTPKNG